MRQTNGSRRALVLTVGTGNVEDIERTLLGPMPLSIRHREWEWDRIVLLPSRETKEAAQVLSSRLQEEGCSQVLIEELPEKGQENDADACFGHFYNVLGTLIQHGFEPSDIFADFTRGTKAMSAALVLASIGRNVQVLRYVHSEERDERGMVVPGTEKVGEIRTVLATGRRRLELAEDLMRRGDFGAVTDLLSDVDGQSAATLVPESLQSEAAALRAVAQIYAAWDRLDYKDAVEVMDRPDSKAAGKAGVFAPTLEMGQWLKGLAQRPEQADHEAMAAYLRMLACDLLANAERRLRDRHFEDALLRAYRVLELVGQIRLFALGHNSAALSPDNEKIQAFQGYLEKKSKKKKKRERGFDTNSDGTLTASRELAARLLKHLHDPLAKRLLDFDTQGKFGASSRNHSVLIHGFEAKALGDRELRTVLAGLEELLSEDDGKAGDRLKVARSLSFAGK